MSYIFISHSSVDDDAVSGLSQWLDTTGFKDHFVDHRDIPGGGDWDRILPEKLAQADILLLYVTCSWLASTECFSEYRAHYYANRPVIPLLIVGTLDDLPKVEAERFKALCSSVQGILFGPVPPNALTEKLLRGSLDLAAATLRKRRRGKQFRLAAIFAALMLVTLSGLAVYFRDGLGAYVDRQRIALAFAAFPPEITDELVLRAATPSKRTAFPECTDTAICPNMIALPPGRFKMGSADDFMPNSSELPVHEISILAGLAISVSEITRAQWYTCFVSTRLKENPSCKEIPRWVGQEDHPVESVSWRDAKAYVAWLNLQLFGTSDGPYRLLSEAEWEYAARGATRVSDPHTLFSWGDTLEPEVCRFANARNFDMPDALAIELPGVDCRNNPVMTSPACPNNPVMTSPVNCLAPNDFGLFDTAGNVAEWVEDCWHDDHKGRPKDARARTLEVSSSCERVIKGGSWAGEVDNLRPAARVRLQEDLFGFNIGFRVARDLNWRPDT